MLKRELEAKATALETRVAELTDTLRESEDRLTTATNDYKLLFDQGRVLRESLTDCEQKLKIAQDAKDILNIRHEKEGEKMALNYQALREVQRDNGELRTRIKYVETDVERWSEVAVVLAEVIGRD